MEEDKIIKVSDIVLQEFTAGKWRTWNVATLKKWLELKGIVYEDNLFVEVNDFLHNTGYITSSFGEAEMLTDEGVIAKRIGHVKYVALVANKRFWKKIRQFAIT